ncbi:asparagine synthase (glutamine-hydrolyzing) [Pseudomonadales bacterium]|nr:asparagine synthase (glutamine-hydrolyzing) [Pseudomonadales bacterium]
MCAIFGTFSFDGSKINDIDLKGMAQILNHRGPDANGAYSDGLSAVGNCRLSIIDLSESSNQPIFSDNKKVSVVQNGEIYNYLELKTELLGYGYTFNTQGDTEVILRAYEYWGSGFVKKLNGMFSIAIFDQGENKILLYRDRLGVKPLYVHGNPEVGRLWFASEIKALLKAGIKPEPNLDALAQYLALNYVPPPCTAFKGISHVMPGHMVEITLKGSKSKKYWDLSDVEVDHSMNYEESKKNILELLDDATRIRMRADAPYGAFLSGGLDSSSVVGFMEKHKSEPIKTFSMGFSDNRFDETKYAIMASKRFNTVHKKGIMEYDAATMWPTFVWHTDQPHGDISFIPTYMVSTLAAHDTKMVLTGDGGDELFAGYTKYADFIADDSINRQEQNWEKHFAAKSGLLSMHDAGNFLCGELKDTFINSDPWRALAERIDDVPHQDPINKILYAETSVLLPGNNLVKPDRMAMANSLEVRSPYLDYRLVELAFSIQGKYKLQNGVTKSILKDALMPLLGNELTHRKKQMFTVPVGEWFKSSLRDFCEEVLFDGRLGARGMVNESFLKKAFESHCDGKANYTREIRAFISLEIWFRTFIDDGLKPIEPLELSL